MSAVNSLLTALRGINANRLRAGLTTLGIVIGVASVIVMLALGNGARAAVEANFRFLGSDQVQVGARQTIEKGELTPTGKPLTYADGLAMVDEIDLIQRVNMAVSAGARLRYERSVIDMPVSGVMADALEGMLSEGQVQPAGWPEGKLYGADDLLSRGRFFTYGEVVEGAAVCVLGYDTAADLFVGEDPLGQTVWVNRAPCTVIGVLAELESTDPQQRYNGKTNDALFLPISTAIQSLFDKEPSVAVTAYVKDETRMDEAKQAIIDLLRQRHSIDQDQDGKYQDDFDLLTRKDILGAQQEAARTFSLLLAAMAVVSLVVGGIGIMNVMLVSVSERTTEIGIRLAIGAQPRDIVAQFLLEAVLISAGGGILGMVLGIIIIPVAAAFNQGMALLAPNSLPLAFSVAVLVGVIFGLYPAARASRLNPMDALRHE